LTAAPARLVSSYFRKFGLVGITLRIRNAERYEYRRDCGLGTVRGHAIGGTSHHPAHLPEAENHYRYRANDTTPDPRFNPRRNLHDCYSHVEEKSLLHSGPYGALEAGGSLAIYSGLDPRRASYQAPIPGSAAIPAQN